MKPFNLKEAKAGKPVCTRDGKDVRIICFDAVIHDFPIIGLIKRGDWEFTESFQVNGHCITNESHPNDLMMKSETKEGWVNVYESAEKGRVPGELYIHPHKTPGLIVLYLLQ